MTGGLSLTECGRVLGLPLPEGARAALDKAGIGPMGGTTVSPRYNARHVHELAAIRASRKSETPAGGGGAA